MSTALKLTLTLLSGGLVALGFYLLDWEPRWRQLEQLERDVAARRARLEQARQQMQQLPALERQLHELEAAVPRQRELAPVVRLEEAVRSTDLQVLRVSAASARSYQVELRGDFHRVVGLLQRLGPVPMRRLTFSKPDAGPLCISFVTEETGR